MVDVYLSAKRDLLVVKKGFPVPLIGASGKWRKSKKRVIKISDEIRSALQRQGYYMRKLSDRHSNIAQEQIIELGSFFDKCAIPTASPPTRKPFAPSSAS
jgi:hypothetical protein